MQLSVDFSRTPFSTSPLNFPTSSARSLTSFLSSSSSSDFFLCLVRGRQGRQPSGLFHAPCEDTMTPTFVECWDGELIVAQVFSCCWCCYPCRQSKGCNCMPAPTRVLCTSFHASYSPINQPGAKRWFKICRMHWIISARAEPTRAGKENQVQNLSCFAAVFRNGLFLLLLFLFLSYYFISLPSHAHSYLQITTSHGR